MTETADVAVIVLTKNEEANLAYTLKSVRGWAKQLFVFDSFSTDRTAAIAAEHGATFVQHAFVDYSKQRNAALDTLPLTAAWTLFLDADEQVTEPFKAEVARAMQDPRFDGYELALQFLWRGTWVRRGYYRTSFKTALFRTGKARCDDRGVNEHILVQGRVGRLEEPLRHEDHRGLVRWLEKHLVYAQLEARRARTEQLPSVSALWGSSAERKNWIRWHLWQRFPPALRASALFGKRALLDGAILDGPAALEYHFFQALWLQLVIGALEAEAAEKARSDAAERS